MKNGYYVYKIQGFNCEYLGYYSIEGMVDYAECDSHYANSWVIYNDVKDCSFFDGAIIICKLNDKVRLLC